MTSTALKDLADIGVLIWLDDLSRERMSSATKPAARRTARHPFGAARRGPRDCPTPLRVD
jgi:hypothetical protein